MLDQVSCQQQSRVASSRRHQRSHTLASVTVLVEVAAYRTSSLRVPWRQEARAALGEAENSGLTRSAQHPRQSAAELQQTLAVIQRSAVGQAQLPQTLAANTSKHSRACTATGMGSPQTHAPKDTRGALKLPFEI